MITQQLLDKINNELDSTESIPITFPLNGQFQHFKHGKSEPSSSHIWVIGYSWEYKGNSYQWAKVGDWRSGTHFVVKSYDPTTETKQAVNNAKKYIEQAEETAKAEKEKKHTDCKEKYEPMFNELHASGKTHPYLILKKSKSNYRARLRGETLLIPIEHPDHGFVGCQQIFKDKTTNKFVKYFTKGIRITGSYTRLTNFDLKKTELIYLTEGYATATSIYQATNTPTVIAFNCNNLIPVIASIRKINKSIKIIIAGDDDHQVTKPPNPGRYKASLAVKQFTNIISIFPSFKNPDGLSDFNDLHVTESIESVQEQLKYSAEEFVEIRCLGIGDNLYHYLNTQTGQIFSLTAMQHNDSVLVSQASRKYWGQRFAFKKNKENEPTKTPDWDLVKESLFSEQRNMDYFEQENIRGIGGWLDGKNIVFNSGKFLYVNGVKEPITSHSVQSKYIYEAKKNISFNIDNLPTQDEIDSIDYVFSNMSYKSPGDYMYVIGAIILAQTPGLWDWRSHQWITGCRGSGKTTALQWIESLVFTRERGIIEDTTAAGIRGHVKNDAISCILDEAEASDVESRRRMNAVMALIRQSSSNSGSVTLRGTQTGGSISSLINSMFIMGSIQTSLNNDADNSRFTVIELTKGDPDKFLKMKEIAQIFPELKMKLLAFSLKYAHLIRSNQPIIKHELLQLNDKIDARQADQMSWLFSAYWTFTKQTEVNIFELDMTFMVANVNDSEYIEANQSDDNEECLSTILGIMTPDRDSLIDCITTETKQRYLLRFGVKVIKSISDSEYHVFFSSKNSYLKRALDHTEYHDYAKLLRRMDCVVKYPATLRIDGLVKKGLIIRLDLSDNIPNESSTTVNTVDQNNTTSHEIDVPF